MRPDQVNSTGAKTIVISAVNLNHGGTLTILRDCLSYLSQLAMEQDYRIIAIVYKKELADYANIAYIETQWPKQRWVNRLWYEYVSMKKISKQLGPVYLWLSLHDTTPNVLSERRAVYCHNPFPFYKWKIRECFFAPKIVLFALFSKFIYQTNIHNNDYVIVQQQWLKDAFKKLFRLPQQKIIVALPDKPAGLDKENSPKQVGQLPYTFIYAASPNSHKNFECICQAAALLEEEGLQDFKISITVSGHENKYARWLFEKWGRTVTALDFIGFQNRQSLFSLYAGSDCLLFPSKVETWGLPITEFAAFNKPMLLANLPYAKETAAEASKVGFFDPDRPDELALQMRTLIHGDRSFLQPVTVKPIEAPISHTWAELFQILLH